MHTHFQPLFPPYHCPHTNAMINIYLLALPIPSSFGFPNQMEMFDFPKNPNANFLLAIPFLFAALFVARYLFCLWRKCNYWPRRGVPGPLPRLFSGNLFPLFFGGQSAVLTLHEWSQRFGRCYGIFYGRTPVLVISEPAMVHELLVTKFWHFNARLIGPIAGNIDDQKWVHLFNARGIRWKRLRAIATPAFSVSNLKRIMPTIDDSITVCVNALAQQQGTSIDIHSYFVEMAFDIIARVAMGQPGSRQFCHSSDAQLAVHAIQRINNNLFDYYAWMFPWFGRRVLRPLASWTRKWRDDPIDKLLAKIQEAVKERKVQREKENLKGQKQGHAADFIDLFLDAEADELDHFDEEEMANVTDKIGRVERRNCLEEVVMQCFLFVLAGFDTTSSSLSQICHRLAWNPKVQTKILQEIEAVFGCENDEMPSYDQLGKLKYMEAVIKETLRLSPRVITRVCTQTTSLGNHLLVEEGTGVQVDVLNLHRDTSVWGDDAHQFVPERWELDRDLSSPPPPYYAFGAGPRMCIGLRMALLENKMALVRLLRRFSIERCAQMERDLEFTGQVVLAPKSVTVRLSERRSVYLT